MDLFNTERVANILPFDGIASYHGIIMNQQKANAYFDALMKSIAWKNDEAIVYGKHIITDRKVAWYGNSNYDYTYSNTTKKALIWTPELLELKKLTEEITATTYNSCLLNLYHNGNEGMAWHSDDEKSLGKDTSIASLSFGAERNFHFKHKTKGHKVSVLLNHGSLLEMKGSTQTYWLHRLPKTTLITRPRVNLTFRTIVNQM